ncbi:HEAT repeat domain-containing protein [Gloeobacter violaceus]|uniref:Glr3391 protein n=1 Tax=Gloeobacter violaceus (strain ATCC 29082 / PCC 7421) TaxID=251221 RepID=Q7NFY3_GLOVI|nr:HEAT repeat domain-containing protein [Gloeobacter violaceus]BAC91332.1 glr3391 [Gloeobacter violaceus PCC 7421]
MNTYVQRWFQICSTALFGLCSALTFASVGSAQPFNGSPAFYEPQPAVVKRLDSLKSMVIDKDPKVRAQAVEELGRIYPISLAIPALLIAVKDHNAEIRSAATCTLAGTAKESEYVQSALIEALQDKAFKVRYCAIQVLDQAELTSSAVVAALVETLNDKDSQISAGAAGALGKIGVSAQAAIPSLEALKAKGGYSGRAAGRALASIRPEKPEDELSPTLELDVASGQQIRGKDVGLGLQFDARVLGVERNRIDIYFGSGKQVIFDNNLKQNTLTASSFYSETREPAEFSEADIKAFQKLYRTISRRTTLEHNSLTRTFIGSLMFLSDAFPGYVLDYKGKAR